MCTKPVMYTENVFLSNEWRTVRGGERKRKNIDMMVCPVSVAAAAIR